MKQTACGIKMGGKIKYITFHHFCMMERFVVLCFKRMKVNPATFHLSNIQQSEIWIDRNK